MTKDDFINAIKARGPMTTREFDSMCEAFCKNFDTNNAARAYIPFGAYLAVDFVPRKEDHDCKFEEDGTDSGAATILHVNDRYAESRIAFRLLTTWSAGVNICGLSPLRPLRTMLFVPDTHTNVRADLGCSDLVRTMSESERENAKNDIGDRFCCMPVKSATDVEHFLDTIREAHAQHPFDVLCFNANNFLVRTKPVDAYEDWMWCSGLNKVRDLGKDLGFVTVVEDSYMARGFVPFWCRTHINEIDIVDRNGKEIFRMDTRFYDEDYRVRHMHAVVNRRLDNGK